uniref:Uncharacterized protein n=1 Tax=Macrostomum lignano TaxID=282301 RepID=A0A1I8FJ81_9PLAT
MAAVVRRSPGLQIGSLTNDSAPPAHAALLTTQAQQPASGSVPPGILEPLLTGAAPTSMKRSLERPSRLSSWLLPPHLRLHPDRGAGTFCLRGRGGPSEAQLDERFERLAHGPPQDRIGGEGNHPFRGQPAARRRLRLQLTGSDQRHHRTASIDRTKTLFTVLTGEHSPAPPKRRQPRLPSRRPRSAAPRQPSKLSSSITQARARWPSAREAAISQPTSALARLSNRKQQQQQQQATATAATATETNELTGFGLHSLASSNTQPEWDAVQEPSKSKDSKSRDQLKANGDQAGEPPAASRSAAAGSRWGYRRARHFLAASRSGGGHQLVVVSTLTAPTVREEASQSASAVAAGVRRVTTGRALSSSSCRQQSTPDCRWGGEGYLSIPVKSGRLVVHRRRRSWPAQQQAPLAADAATAAAPVSRRRRCRQRRRRRGGAAARAERSLHCVADLNEELRLGVKEMAVVKIPRAGRLTIN